MKKILVIVDMIRGAAESRYHRQYLNRKWWKRHADTVANIRILARTIPEIIFVIDTTCRKEVHHEVIDGLGDLTLNAALLFKNQGDGSEVIMAYLERNNLTNHQLIVCGMNTDACVIRTARGLHRRGLNTVVVGDACWTVYASKSSRTHHNALSRMRRTYGMSVVQTQSA